jgi:hypothetical protein
MSRRRGQASNAFNLKEGRVMPTINRETWTYPSDLYAGDIDLVGYEVEALDGDIGKIDEATYDTGASYVVVDTGPWIFGKKVMLPASVIDRIEPADEKVFVNRSKDEIKNAPEFDEDAYHDDAYRTELGSYYGRGGTGYRNRRT